MKSFLTSVVVGVALTLLGHVCCAEVDCDEMVNSVEAFLIMQMERFDGVRPPDQPPLVQTYGWDPACDFRYPPPPACNPSHVDAWKLEYRGDTYDQALAALWFTERARLDYTGGRVEDGDRRLYRARRLLDCIILLRDYDPIPDGRLRMAYWANNLITGPTTSIMDPSAGAGNIAWCGIAMTRFYVVAKEYGRLDCAIRLRYKEAAKRLGDWILTHCTDDDRPCRCGFTGGYEGWGQTRMTWKATEHNATICALASNLFELTGEKKWKDMAESARCFVRSMFHVLDPGTGYGYYLTGVMADGCTPNTCPIPADAQVWTALAGVDTLDRARQAMTWLVENLLLDCCPNPSDCCKGVKWSKTCVEPEATGIVTEATGGAAMALSCQGSATADCLYNCLHWVRLNGAPPDDCIDDGIGVAVTPWPECAFSGYRDGWYYPLLHVASSAWAGFACLYREGDRWANPLQPLAAERICGDFNRDCEVNVLDLICIRNCLGQDPSGPCRHADVNNDCRVDILDLIVARNNLRRACEPFVCQ